MIRYLRKSQRFITKPPSRRIHCRRSCAGVQGRRTGLTFAPEAGSWRMRQIINKLITEEDLMKPCAAYSQGWHRVKLYFLTGLPSEMDDDTLAIADLAENCVK